MIWNTFKLSVCQLMNRPWEMALTFVLPIIFFSIFALIFGKGIQSNSKRRISFSAIDEVGDRFSQNLITALESQEEFELVDLSEYKNQKKHAASLVQRGDIKACLVLSDSSSQDSGISNEPQSWSVKVLADTSDQLSVSYLESAIQQYMMHRYLHPPADSSLLPSNHEEVLTLSNDGNNSPSDPGVHQAEGGEVLLSPAMNKSAAGSRNQTSSIQNLEDNLSDNGVNFDSNGFLDDEIQIEIVNVLADGKSNPVVSMYAAGIAVMFLLFNATSSSGVLLEERENQTLDRLLSSELTMDHLLLGKWFYMAFVGTLQVAVMFLWASQVFSVELMTHLDGFLMMTISTSLAVSGFGLFMATLCQSRSQLNGVSTVLVLTMSALGGSMVPRYLMSDSLQKIGLFTFNAWAIDGYDKIFWRELPVNALAPQLAVLTLSGVVFLSLARLLAVRWETR